jgi:hypothetical protein
MWTKTYGKTGKDVSVVSFGGMRFPEPEKIDEMAQLVLYAHDKGINLFDTAPFYCQDKSEDIMGAAFRQMPRESFYCCTKCGSADGKQVRESLEKSLERLGVEKVDFFYIWCIVNPEQWEQRKTGGAVDALHKAKEEGLIDHVVVSSHLQGEDLQAVLADGLVEGVLLGYCAMNFPYRQQAVDAAGQMGLGVVTMNPLAGGLIPDNPGRFDFLRASDDRNVVDAAIRFNVSQPAITSALVGFSTREHVDQAVAAVENFTPYPPEHTERVRKKVVAEFDGICTGCGYCLPCPMGINVPRMMDAYNQKLLSGGKDGPVTGRLKYHWQIDPAEAATCSLCGVCEDRCTQHLPIRDRMKEIADLAEADE